MRFIELETTLGNKMLINPALVRSFVGQDDGSVVINYHGTETISKTRTDINEIKTQLLELGPSESYYVEFAGRVEE